MQVSQPKKPPPTSKWSQQELPVWQPIINFRTMWKAFAGIGFILVMISLILISVLLSQEEEIRIPYAGNPGSCCEPACNLLLMTKSSSCSGCMTKTDATCTVEFEVTEKTKLPVPVYVYYELQNFHQNHRSYVSSRDDIQLLGRIYDNGKIIKPDTDSCKKPFRDNSANSAKNESIGATKFYFPCGAIANSFFSDRFQDLTHVEKGKIHWDEKDITWTEEKKYKFRNPKQFQYKSSGNGTLKPVALQPSWFTKNFVKPRDWSDATWDDWWNGGALENPHFINWMHPAPISTFRKLYAIIKTGCTETNQEDNERFLCPGKYSLKILYRFNVDRFKGKKTIILATTKFWGTRKPFLVWFGLAVGIICIAVAITFYFLDGHLKKFKVHPQRRSFIPLPVARKRGVDTATSTQTVKSDRTE